MLAVLGDSVGVGIGDPAHGGGWRGFAPLLAEALGAVELVNVSASGLRVGGARERLARVLRAGPDVGVLLVGMNDTMRSDFDPVRLGAELDEVLSALVAAGVLVITVRYHDHHQVFRLPGPLRRALAARIAALNDVLDAAARRHRIALLDLARMPGIYETAAWSVDRLHPSPMGHRMLAQAFATRLAEIGAEVPGRVSLECTGGRELSPLAHWIWLVCKGIPWLCRRGRDLLPYAMVAVLRDIGRRARRPIAGSAAQRTV